MNIWEMIKRSTMFRENKPSSSRIMGYVMMVIILLSGLVAITIELINAIKTWSLGMVYIIPSEHIIILGMWLAHQLTLLGIYKNSKESGNGKAAPDEEVPVKEEEPEIECECDCECDDCILKRYKRDKREHRRTGGQRRPGAHTK